MISIGLSLRRARPPKTITPTRRSAAIGEADRQAAEALARDVARRARPFARAWALRFVARLPRPASRRVSAAVARPRGAAQDALEDPHGFEPLTELMDEWSEAAAESFPTALAEYAALFDDALAAARAPPASGGHPRLQILGLLEARLLSFDCVLLAGLDETVWPPAVETDAFLNRPMRAALGLTAPERRIGQTAHDFVAALGAREAVLSRAKKRGGEPTVASRFLQRLAAAAGAGSQAMADAEERGGRYLAFARALDQPAEFRPARRPAPRPPVELRPQALSVTRIETLRRDPYAIYAEYILRLKPLEAVERDDRAARNGQWRGTPRLQEFVEAYPSGALPPEARERLFAIARARFAPLRADPAFAALNWPQYRRRASTSFSLSSANRAADIAQSGSSGRARSPFRSRAARRSSSARGPTGSTSCARAARGSSTTRAERRRASRSRGRICAAADAGSRDAAARRISRAAARSNPRRRFISSSAAPRAARRSAPAAKRPIFAALPRSISPGSRCCSTQFAREETPYLSRPFPKFASRFSDYDHLARVKEWSTAGDDEEAGDAP